MDFKNKLVTIVALSLVATAISGYAVSKDYEDSVRSWGPWDTLVKPAAGPQAPTPTLLAGPVVPGFGSGDASSFTPTVISSASTATVGRCTAGSLCGYAFIRKEDRQQQPAFAAIGNTSLQTSPQAAIPVLSPIPALVLQDNGNAKTIQTNLSVESISDIALSETVSLLNVSFLGTQFFLGFEPTLGVFISGRTIDIAGTPFAFGFSQRRNNEGALFTRFIYGESTGLDDLNGLNAGNVQANYSGTMISSGTQVSIGVDFGAGTWSGSWNGGQDGRISQSISTDNVNVITGQVGFNASGTLSGANIVSTSVSATDASAISGTVNGSFYGPDAGVLAGAVNITKTTQVYTDGVNRDLFVTTTGDVKLPPVVPQ